jgi:hypothetical protein
MRELRKLEEKIGSKAWQMILAALRKMPQVKRILKIMPVRPGPVVREIGPEQVSAMEAYATAIFSAACM